MKFMKRTNIYKASNVTFNLTTKEAHSYSWWKFVAVIEGKVVFNNYRYSPSTGNHQTKVRRLLNELGIKIDISLPLPGGIIDDKLAVVFEKAEIALCEEFLRGESKKIRTNERNKAKRDAKRAEEAAKLPLQKLL